MQNCKDMSPTELSMGLSERSSSTGHCGGPGEQRRALLHVGAREASLRTIAAPRQTKYEVGVEFRSASVRNVVVEPLGSSTSFPERAKYCQCRIRPRFL